MNRPLDSSSGLTKGYLHDSILTSSASSVPVAYCTIQTSPVLVFNFKKIYLFFVGNIKNFASLL